MKRLLTELQEIKKLLQVIASNQEQVSKKNTVTVKISDLDEYKRFIEKTKNLTF